jgi:hypothetical protein
MFPFETLEVTSAEPANASMLSAVVVAMRAYMRACAVIATAEESGWSKLTLLSEIRRQHVAPTLLDVLRRGCCQLRFQIIEALLSLGRIFERLFQTGLKAREAELSSQSAVNRR